MKRLIIALFVPLSLFADLAYEVQDETIPERGVVHQCRITVNGSKFIIMPPQTWGWSAQARAQKMSFLNADISAGIHVSFPETAVRSKPVDRLKESFPKIILREEFEAVSGLGVGAACEAEVWTTDQYSFVVRESVFEYPGGTVVVRLQVPAENLSRAERGWNMVLNSLRMIEAGARSAR